MQFFRILLVATTAFVLVGMIPLQAASTVTCWAIIAAASWWYISASLKKARVTSHPVGYAIGMGALMSASIFVCGVSARMLALARYGSALHHYIADAMTILGLIISLFIAAILGAIAGLGGSRAPKAWLYIAVIIAAIALVAGIGAPVITSLANAMKD